MTAELPPPRLLADAVADLGAEQVREGYRYLEAWDALVTAGVPRSTLRECLADPITTEPCTKMLQWQDKGARGLLCLVGDPGTGKTYAAARWVVLRHRRGLFANWLAATKLSTLGPREFAPVLAKLADVRALVIDDLGAGATKGDYLRDQLTGLIQQRIDELRPTLIAANGTPEELAEWLGPRIVDRCQVAGGFAPVRSPESLRSRATVELDALGRGPEWYAAHRLVDLLGCEPVTRYDDDGRARVDLDVGRKLHAEAKRSGNEPVKKARIALKLDPADVVAKARELAEREVKLAGEAAPILLGPDWAEKIAANGLSFESVNAALLERMRDGDKLRDAEWKRSREAASARAQAVAAEVPERDAFDGVAVPTWASGPSGRKALKARGFKVVEAGDKFRLERHGQVLADGGGTADACWARAGQLCGEREQR